MANRKESDVKAFQRWLTVCVIAAGAIVSCRHAPSVQRERDEVAREAEGDGDGDVPENDYFYLQRASRDGRINVMARPQALLHAKLIKARVVAQASFAATGQWELRGPLNVGGRVADLIGDPVDANKFYVG